MKKRQDQANNKHNVVGFDNENEQASSINAQQQMSSMMDEMEFCERDVDNTPAAQYLPDEKLFAEVALNIALDQGIFEEEIGPTNWMAPASPATDEQMLEFQVLEKLVNAVTKNRLVVDKRTEIMPNYETSQTQSNSNLQKELLMANGEIEQKTLDLALNIEQSRVHDIVTNHLKAHLEAGSYPSAVAK
jgi:hypothetical protein